ncbi:MAG: 2-amino-4-hydroxy-6-hydroxymethyldihydropteridine diphosphokinase [Rhodoferax sp.]|nr:2-amino-4-hydroxy-6-hydroxymethyldihydropteridine diphosphokinase [Rhodoferax sp.]MBK9238494.1 2-amino-4-hydroxy-6-hydroxymethyldihydropteridine diphosphokinase [Rhodoferax sp.]
MNEAAVAGGVTAYIGLGSNLGDARAAVLRAMEAIAVLPGTALRRRSSLYRSAPVDASGPDFINAVVEVVTELTAPALLAELLTLEHAAGRVRPYRNAPRTLDLDLLLYGDACIRSPALCVPHPRMAERAFVLQPLAQIAPQRVDAADLQATAAQAIERLPDR